MPNLKPEETLDTAPSPAPSSEPATPLAPATPQPQPQIVVQMVENKAAEPTQGLSETVEGGSFKHNGKTYDAYLRPIS